MAASQAAQDYQHPGDTKTATAQEKPGTLTYTTVICYVTSPSPDPMRRALEIVFTPPVGQHHLELEQGVELLAVQELVAEPTVEVLDPGVLPRWTRVDEHCLGTGEPVPVDQDIGDELGLASKQTYTGTPRLEARRSKPLTSPSTSMERSTSMASVPWVNSSTIWSILPSAVWSNWRSIA